MTPSVRALPESPWRRPIAPYWMSQRSLHLAFLAFFVLFLVVGVALTVLGFLDYGGHGGPMTRAFRVLGVVALLLCIGFLIAACVVVSECITSSIKRGSTCSDDEGDDLYGYRALYPTSCETIANTTSFHGEQHNAAMTMSGSDFSTIIPNVTSVQADQVEAGAETSASTSGQPPLGLCPSCSCQLIARPVGFKSGVAQSMSYPNGIVQFQKKRDTAVIQMGSDELFNKRMLPRVVAPPKTNYASDSDISSENDERWTADPRDWV